MNDFIERQKNPAPTIRELLAPLGKAGTKNNPNTCTAKITFATRPIMRKSPYAGMYFNGQGRPKQISPDKTASVMFRMYDTFALDVPVERIVASDNSETR